MAVPPLDGDPLPLLPLDPERKGAVTLGYRHGRLEPNDVCLFLSREAFDPMNEPSPHPPRRVENALVLCGGGLTGAFYEIGALCAIAEEGVPFRPQDAQVLVGTSAGAFVAGVLAAGMSLERLRGSVLGEPGTIPLRRRDFYHLEPGRAASLFLRALGVGTSYLTRITRRKVVEGTGTFETLANSRESLPSGLFRTTDYLRFVETVFRAEGLPTTFGAIPRTLFVTATDLDTGERVVFGPQTPSVSIPAAVVASGAIPMFYEPFWLGGRYLIDGESTEVAHIDLALALGARRVLVLNPKVPVHLDPAARRRAADGSGRVDRGGFFAILDQSNRLTARVRLHHELEYANASHPETEILLHQPEEAEAMPFLYNPMTFSAKDQVFRYGYESTRARIRSGRLGRRA